jgi:hypothetical protein
VHAETYGSFNPSKTSTANVAYRSKLETVTFNIMGHMWALKEPAVTGSDKKDARGMVYTIKVWKIDGKEMCKAAWIEARGGAKRRHRSLCKHKFDLLF